jgi:hypothetical protein
LQPCILPYDELPPGQRAKDALFVSIFKGACSLKRIDTPSSRRDKRPMLYTILLIILILALLGAFPTRGYGIGYGAHGGIGLLIVIILILLFLQR